MSAACATPQMMVFPVPIQTLYLSHIHSLHPPVWYKPASHHRTALPAMAIVTGCSMANSQKALVWSILAINQHLHPHRRVNESTYRYYVVVGVVDRATAKVAPTIHQVRQILSTLVCGRILQASST